MITITLQNKILSGYIVILIVVGCMSFILFYERSRVRNIENEYSEIVRIRHHIHTAHQDITELATLGESVMAWEREDYQEYHNRRLLVDSLLQTLESECGEMVQTGAVDTLRYLLADKEYHLLHIMQVFHGQEKADSLLARQLPIALKQIARPYRTTRRKGGIAGLFGAKETVQVLPSSKELYSLNEKLVSMQEKRVHDMSIYTDSLRRKNKELNRRLSELVVYLDKQVQNAFSHREQQMNNAWKVSHRLMTGVFTVAVILLLVSYLIIQKDIVTREKQRKKQQGIIEENEGLLQMRKNIILTVSHDIRGPLGNIINSAELAMETREKKKRNGYLENILALSRHILHLVCDLMDVYRINEAKDIRNSVPFHPSGLLGRIAEGYRQKANGNGLLFEDRHEHADITVKGDADKIEQILGNLLTNAIKFTRFGKICFLSEYSAGKLSVKVIDTGIGMDEETLSRIFRPFERAAQEVSSEGFGLGLYITNGLVNALEGHIHVESVPGKGTTFLLTLPLPETDEEPEGEEVISETSLVLPEKVLVVDDDPVLLRIIYDMLLRNGIICITCSNVKEAVAELRRENCDLILTDIQMPETDGFGLLKLLRNSDIGNSRRIPVAAMTARGDGDSGIYVKQGFCGCLHKPFTMNGLLVFISAMVSRSGEPEAEFSFNFSRLLEEITDRKETFVLLIEESRKNMEELEKALQTFARGDMRMVVHRMFPVWELLDAGFILQTYRNVLHDRNVDNHIVMKHTRRVIGWIKRLIDESQKILENETDEKENIGCGR